MNILRLKIGTITKITNLVSVIKEQKYFFESEKLYNVQVISLLVLFQMNHQNDISLLIKDLKQ